MSTTNALRVRPLRADDRAEWDVLWGKYQAFYDVTVKPSVSDHVYTTMISDDTSMLGLGATAGRHLVGFAHIVVHPSTWSVRSDGYLEDLFVLDGVRGQGVGRALITGAMAVGRGQGWRRVHWHTEHDNLAARGLYDQVADLSGYVRYMKPIAAER